MTIEELKSKGAIYVEQIKTGLSQYRNEILVMNQEQAYEFFWKKWREEYPEDAFVDFYYFSLPLEARQKVDETLSDKEREYLKELQGRLAQESFKEEGKGAFVQENSKEEGKGASVQKDYTEEIIFPMEEKLLRIVTKLNQQEMLFSTIYFTGERSARSTWWGNYKGEYVAFWEG